jgi:LuxR family transcriptional regulator, maltose regulon positive regulatory protein
MLKPVALLNPRPALPRDPAIAEWALGSKLEPHRLRINTVVRQTLLKRLDEASELSLTLLLAPPGFGKSTALAQWYQELRTRGDVGVAWLSLDEDDADPARLLAYVAIALQTAGVDLGASAVLFQQPDPDLGLGTAALIRALRQHSRRVLLLLDDYDRAANPTADDLLLRLLEHAGTRLHLLLSTRRPPAMPLARLAAQGNLARLGCAELALDEDETRTLLGERVAAHAASELRGYTEGWPVALQLAALWLRGHEGRLDETAHFSGRSAEIAAYLTEQVVNDLSRPLRDFLLCTAPLERFNAALADKVRHSVDSGLLLAQLDHFHGLLVPLDDERDWFRYHPLFADYLLQQLERERPGQGTTLYQRAARWFGEHGHLPEAVRHAVRGGADELAAGYIARAGSWQLVLRHGPSQVKALLRHFDRHTIRKTPALNLTQAYLHMKLGEFGHAQVLLERYRDFPAALREPFERDYTVVIALLRDLLDEICSNPQGIAQLAAQAAALDEDDHLSRGTLLCICATTALGQGAFDAAQRLAERAGESMQHSASDVGASYALLHLGQAHFYRGRIDEAEAIYRQVLQLAQTRARTDQILQAAGSCLLAQLLCERGRHDAAADLLTPAIDFIEQHDGWLDIYASAYETALSLELLRDRSGRSALERLDGIEQLAHRRRLARLSELAVAWRLGVLLEQPTTPAIGMLIARAGGESGLAHAMQRPHGWRQRAALGFAIARWHGLTGRASAALALLRQIEDSCLSSGNIYHLVRCRTRIAMVLQQRGENDAARPYLQSTLDHVALTRSWQVVIELGLPAKAMLRSFRQLDPDSAAGTTRALTIQTLLDKLSSEEDNGADALSERELEVLSQLAHGYSNKQIGRRLHLSENTVKFHLKNLYRKLDARTREAALAVAGQRGLLRGDEQPAGDA